MRIRLDTERCQGHGRCYALAPDLFGCDDDGYAILLVDGDLPAAAESEGEARRRQLPRVRDHRRVRAGTVVVEHER